jgi:hypothetical protein
MKYFFGILTIVVIFIFISVICYIRPPLGDDVLGMFTNGVSYYSIESKNIDGGASIGKRVETIADSFIVLYNNYKYWSGRAIGAFLISLPSIWGEIFTALLSGIIITSVILAAGILIYGSLKSSLKHSCALIIIFLSTYYFHPGISFSIMWTMISIYSVSILFILCYLIFFRKIIYSEGNIDRLKIILFNVLGFFTGLTHEIYTVSLCFYLLFLSIFGVKIHAVKLKSIFCHIGLILGTAFCVFSPGNFARMKSPHDVRIFNPWIMKAKGAVLTHIVSLVGVYPRVPFFVLLMAFIFMVYTIIMVYRHIKIKVILDKHIREIMFVSFLPVMLIISLLLWSLVSYTPFYGMLLLNIFVFVFIFSTINIFTNYISVHLFDGNNIFAVIFCCFLIFVNRPWIISNFRTRIEWNRLIKHANADKLKEVHVPKFDEKYSNRFNFYNYNNDEKEFRTDYYMKYYNIEVIPLEEQK